ncbi:MAG TPA: zinc-dependent alcohol dehydrogenase family protein [Syntrophobacteraceae bacterium]|nr:zinc-dependent alcohol dehydrogenase family protein [Syntrophobacteraceae bacterium]
MKATVFYAPGDLRVEKVPDPAIKEQTDAIVRVTHACICGSDLWFYRGLTPYEAGWRIGHEWMGIVEEVGAVVRTIRKGDRVIAPFIFSDGQCEFCRKGLPTSCVHGGVWGMKNDGGQGEMVRTPFADANLVALPPTVENDDALLKAVLPLTDVMGTGHHAAVSAGVGEGRTVAIVGDGAVGLCSVLAACRLGAGRIIILGHQNTRLELAQRFGASDLITNRGDEAVGQVIEMTKGGADSVMECVGTSDSLNTAIGICRPGGSVSCMGVPHHSSAINFRRMFLQNISLRGGVAPVRAYIPELLPDVLTGRLDPSPVLDLTVDLAGVPEGYRAMDMRKAIKVMVMV